jgi:hypothetical protein
LTLRRSRGPLRPLMVPIRQTPPQPGLPGWVYDTTGLPLPDGLPEGTPIKVLEQEGRHAVVQDAAGHEWPIDAALLDCGCAFYIGLEWLEESHPTALVYLEEEAIRHASSLPTSEQLDGIQKHVHWLQRVLLRNGRPFASDTVRRVFEQVQAERSACAASSTRLHPFDQPAI